MRPAKHRNDLVRVHLLERDHVDLDVQARRLRGIDPGQGLGMIAPAGDRLVFDRVERIERHIDTAHAGVREFSCVPRELRAIRCEGQFLKRAGLDMAAKTVEQLHDIAADQGLSAGDPEFFDATRGKCGAETVELFQAEQIPLRQEIHVFGHAIDTAHVAAIGHRDADIGDRAAEGIGKRRRGRDRRSGRCFENGIRESGDDTHGSTFT
jgi:hypothetical protein